MKNSLKTLLIFIIIDFILSILFFTIFGYPSASSEAELLIIPVIFILNILLAIVLLLKITDLLKIDIYKMFLINAILACLIFIIVDFTWYYFLDKMNYKRMIFKVEKQKYELNLRYKYSTYEIYEKHDGYGTNPIMEGKVKFKGDSVLLYYKNDIMFVYKDSLAGFQNYPKLALKGKYILNIN